MKYHPVTTSKFAKDYDQAKKRGKDVKTLKGVIGTLLDGTKLMPAIDR
jgi:mRNA-degrading endonuclease YafQ of YafQ-DinJ toxin-antitoxin module